VIDAAALATADSDQLTSCAEKLVLRIEAARPPTGARPVHRVDIMDTCWLWKAAPTDGMKQLTVSLDRMPWNYQLGDDVSGVVVRPNTGPDDALDVYLDGCVGSPIANLPLGETTAPQITLTAALPAQQGQHALCFIVTGDPKLGLWAIDQVRLTH